MNAVRVVIAGGGVAGHKLAYSLQNGAEVTLIDPKPFFEIPFAVPRLFAAPGELPSIVPYADFLPKTRRIEGVLEAVASGQVTVRKADGSVEQVSYDYLALTTGANYRSALVKPLGFTSVADRLAHFERVNSLIERAGRVLIVGGGTVAVEIAGEILQTFPEKRVTLVEAGPQILPRTTDKARALAMAFLKKHQVGVILGEMVQGAPPPNDVAAESGEAVTDKGTRIEYDLALWCLGTKPDAHYMKSHYPAMLNAHGEIQVEPTLLVKGLANVFALGDVADFREKGAGWAAVQSKVLEGNLRALIKNGPGAALKKYKRPMAETSMILTLGRYNGVASMPFGVTAWPWLLQKFKSRTMGVPWYRRAIGLS
jgi:apoptosis-inducing factor 2